MEFPEHLALSLFGIYLIRTKQVEFHAKNCLGSASIIFGSATVMLILNLIFDTAFFGLSLTGKHSIYNKVLVDNSYVSALVYYAGLLMVLLLGYGVCKLLHNKSK